MNKYLTIALLGCVLMLSANAHAQESERAEMIVQQPAPDVKHLSAGDLAKIETIGLYSTSSEGGYDKDLWAGSARSDITTLLRVVPASSKTPVMNKMILGILLTKAKAGALENDVLPAPGDDLLTLRLEKLLEAGAYEQAYEIYVQLEDAPYHERLAHAGILSFLYNGEKSNACLETKTYKLVQASDFWKQLTAYCNISLSETPEEADLVILQESGHKLLSTLASNKEFIFPYSPDAFNELSTIEQAIIAAEERLDVSTGAALSPDDIPNAHMQILLRHESLSPELRFTLTAKALTLGLIPPKPFEKLYSAISKQQKEQDPDGVNPAPANDWEKLPYYLEKIKMQKKRISGRF